MPNTIALIYTSSIQSSQYDKIVKMGSKKDKWWSYGKMSCFKFLKPRSLSRTFKLATLIVLVLLVCLQIGAYYRQRQEKKLKELQRYEDLVREHKENASLARDPKPNENEVAGVSTMKKKPINIT